jgi:hypothetical protein
VIKVSPHPVNEASEKIPNLGNFGKKNTFALIKARLLDHHSRSHLVFNEKGHLVLRLKLVRLALLIKKACILLK